MINRVKQNIRGVGDGEYTENRIIHIITLDVNLILNNKAFVIQYIWHIF